MKPRLRIIPVFIPQQGCRHRCVYCDQAAITGRAATAPWSAAELRRFVGNQLHGPGARPAQVAFYGGSFTMLPVEQQVSMLAALGDYLRQGRITSIRISTRPDAIQDHHLEVLRDLGVRTVEVGAQSLDDAVLASCGRGHTAADVLSAVRRLQAAGFEVGIQLMLGLPGEDWRSFRATVEAATALAPDLVRLYPTLVLAATPLAALYRNGKYQPLDLETAVSWCSHAYRRMNTAGIKIIRMGLQDTESLRQRGRILAGPYHPAFGQLVRSACWYDRLTPALREAAARHARIMIITDPASSSDIRGHRNSNIRRWLGETGLRHLQVRADVAMEPGSFKLAPMAETPGGERNRRGSQP